MLYMMNRLLDKLENDKCFEIIHKCIFGSLGYVGKCIYKRWTCVCGIIDWERALWGEPFMDDRFRIHNRGKHFLEGFGQTSFFGR